MAGHDAWTPDPLGQTRKLCGTGPAQSHPARCRSGKCHPAAAPGDGLDWPCRTESGRSCKSSPSLHQRHHRSDYKRTDDSKASNDLERLFLMLGHTHLTQHNAPKMPDRKIVGPPRSAASAIGVVDDQQRTLTLSLARPHFVPQHEAQYTDEA